MENLLMTGQDVIGSSLTFSTMTLPSMPSQGLSQGQQSQTTGESRSVYDASFFFSNIQELIPI